jgi:2-keto-4-pentenoate hydratase/2-oxohepta-3-ene-1,7-dioic acid hydratase in catechol pathway
MIDVMEGWENNWPALCTAATRLAEQPDPTGRPVGDLQTLAPIRPRQIICAGANYRAHVIEIMADHASSSAGGDSRDERRRRAERIMDHRVQEGQPYAFIKPYSTVLDPYADLEIPADSHQLDWELELGVVIGKAARRVRQENALDHIAGYVVANDISARDHIARPDFPLLGLDYIAGKGGPGFLPLGPFILPAAFVRDPQDLQITLHLNGQVMQQSSTSDMIFPVARIIEFLSVHMQLLPGDIITTGSPAGNGTHYDRFLRPGDVIEGTIQGMGLQRNRCVAERVAPGMVMHRKFVALETS